MKLINPTLLSEWITPHSLEWYRQLSEMQREYTYAWNSTVCEPNGESIFDEKLLPLIKNKRVLDIGCGEGSFTIKCGMHSKKIVGFDVTDNFIKIGKENQKSNVSFAAGNTKNGLPFKTDVFDCAYIRKGPTSAYPHLKQVVRKGGAVLGLHPGDENGKELSFLFPQLFENSHGTPILDTVKQRIEKSSFSTYELETITSREYIHSPEDVIMLRCFGQVPSVYETLIEENLLEVSKIFDEHKTKYGLPITNSRYIVRVTV
ncbi:class I SAM-dependent methyltransferase [Virgibacillus flavescens]|uniref:class I SAM-dependent methyltransferase n=1 Tax=Virgibacillus flavescens TaxID=1611422 RepID=UPI003D335F03